MATYSREEPRPALNETRARQGRFGRHVFWVLLVSTVLAFVALLAIWGLKSDDLASTTPTSKVTPAEASTYQAPEPAPVTRE